MTSSSLTVINNQSSECSFFTAVVKLQISDETFFITQKTKYTKEEGSKQNNGSYKSFFDFKCQH